MFNLIIECSIIYFTVQLNLQINQILLIQEHFQHNINKLVNDLIQYQLKHIFSPIDIFNS
jgi:hypothetical protein